MILSIIEIARGFDARDTRKMPVIMHTLIRSQYIEFWFILMYSGDHFISCRILEILWNFPELKDNTRIF